MADVLAISIIVVLFAALALLRPGFERVLDPWEGHSESPRRDEGDR